MFSVCVSGSVMSNSLQAHGLQHTRDLCPSPNSAGSSNLSPSSWWCHPTISSSGIPFSSCLQTFPAPGSFQMSQFCIIQFSLSCPTLCNPMDCRTPGFPVHHQLLELAQTHVNWVSDAIQPSHPLLSPSPPTFNLTQYQGLFQWVSSSYQVAKVLKFQLQHQSFQWILRTDLL